MNNWHHLVGVREGAYIRFYVNGTLANSTFVGSASINNVANQHMLLGRTGAGNYTNAGFDELAIYNHALSAAEVGELFGLGCGDFDVAGEELAEGYRYGFNGQEKDDEIKGFSSHYDYGFRVYDPRISKFLSLDPLSAKYPFYTPYQYAGNKPVRFIDIDGLEEGFDIRFNQMQEGYFKGTVSEQDLKDFNRANAIGMVMGIGVVLTGVASIRYLPAFFKFAVSQSVTNPVGTATVVADVALGAAGYDRFGGVPGIDDVYQPKVVRSISEGVKDQLSGRRELARDFYDAFNQRNVDSKLNGIDFNKPVDVVTLEKGMKVDQYLKLDGSKGNYFAPKGTPISELGIDPSLYQTNPTTFILDQNVDVLRSTAADFAGQSGGGTQYFSPELLQNTSPK